MNINAGHGVTVSLNMPGIINKVENDNFGLFLAKEWHRLISDYTPHCTGQLERNVQLSPFTIRYMEPYSHYMYHGQVYVDPQYGVGGFTKDNGATWFSRKGIKKVPSGRVFNYRKDPNPYATHHWDHAAEQAGQKEKLIRSANEYLRRLK